MNRETKKAAVVASGTLAWRQWAGRFAVAFLVGLILSGGRAIFGMYPLGLAALSSSSGILHTVAVFLGVLFGSMRWGGVLPLLTCGVFGLRLGISLWLHATEADEKEGKKPANAHPLRHCWSALVGGQPVLRHSRKRGWLWQDGLRDSVSLSDLWRRLDRGSFREHVAVRMATSALSGLTMGACGLIEGGFQRSDLWGMVFSTLAAPLCTYLLYAAHDRHMRTSSWHETGLLTVLALLCWSLRGHTVPLVGVDLGEGLAFTSAVLVGSSFGVARGGLVGLVCGLCHEPMVTVGLAITGAVTGLFSAPTSGVTFAIGQGYSRALGLLSGAVATVAWCMGIGGIRGVSKLAPELLIGTAVLLPFFAYDRAKLPEMLFGTLPDSRRSERAILAEAALAGREKKLTALGEGVRDMGAMLEEVSEKLIRPGKRELQTLAEGCFSIYCDRCDKRNRCREQEYTAWQGMLNRFVEVLSTEGGVCGSDVPPKFAARCAVMGRVIDEINSTVAHRMGQRRSGDRLRVAAEDYTHMGRLLLDSAKTEAAAGVLDTERTARLERLLACHDFAAGSVRVYGDRYKRIFVQDVDLGSTRMGGEEIAALFGRVIGMPLTVPTFSLDGSVLSMELHTRQCARCTWGQCTRSAASLGMAGVEKDPVENGTFANSTCEMEEESGNGGRDCQGNAMFSTEKGEFSTGCDFEEMTSGDTVAAFVHEGRQYMLLSDGMGSGRMAALTSGMAATILQRLLSSGATLDCALPMLNSILRAGYDECATTLDICEIDLVTMEATFIKSGAAPSFVIRGGSLFRLQSKTVPIGILRALDAERIRFTVQPGDMIVMLSDGIARSFEECAWLLDLLTTSHIRTGDARTAAIEIVQSAAAHGAIDDITAGVLQVTAVE